MMNTWQIIKVFNYNYDYNNWAMFNFYGENKNLIYLQNKRS